MFSKIFSRGKGVFARKALPLFLGLCFVIGAALFSGCSMGNDGGASIYGEWDSGYDGYTITPTDMIYRGYTDYGFGAKIRYVEYFTADSGVIIVEYTIPPTAYSPPGNFQGVYFKELTANTVRLGNAYTAADYTTPVEVTTLELAKEKFKFDNIALYGGELTNASPQTRQNP
ncbi:MAG: hypothetical protein LBB77_09765 [Treponema sp.]|jgi:hypothetical protein|nr:hypothetical protein [Treponema sp.]